MADEKPTRTVDDLVFLLSCALGTGTVDRTRIEDMDLPAVLAEARRHQVEAGCACALQDAGVRDEAFDKALAQAIRKVAIMSAERDAVLAKLDEAGIWHAPLKGSVLAADYPRIGMRQMTDVDILVDPACRDDVRAIMEERGFTVEHYGSEEPDDYRKPPVSNFEIHSELFALCRIETFISYYENVRERLLPVEGTCCRLRFRDEDLYLYLLAHAYKHFAVKGIGLRSVMDVHVLLSAHGEGMDWGYIAAELEKLGLTEFEADNRRLARHLFCEGELDERDRGLLSYLAESGAFGTRAHMVDNALSGQEGAAGKARYIRGRIILPMDVVRSSHPFFYQHKILLPLLPVYRLVKGMRAHRGQIASEVDALRRKR